MDMACRQLKCMLSLGIPPQALALALALGRFPLLHCLVDNPAHRSVWSVLPYCRWWWVQVQVQVQVP
jgi:hypothetical protein